MVIRSAIVLLLILAGSAPATAQSWASKMFKTTRHDFGTVARGSKAEFEFVFENIYREDIHIASVRSSCGCTSPTVTKRDLKTFEKASIIARYDTRGFVGQRGATITVVIDKPQYAEVQLDVTGYIRSDVVFDPGSVNFGDVDQFSPATKTVKLTYAERGDWEIVDVLSSRNNDDRFVVDVVESGRGGGRVSYELRVQLNEQIPAGHFRDQLTLVTNDVRLKQIPLVVHGKVVSPVTVNPEALFLGVLRPGQTVTKRLIVLGKRPFKVLKVSCEDGCFTFAEPSDKADKRHFIPVTFTPETAGKVAEKIFVETDLGQGAVASCVASATVREAGAE